MDNKVKNSLCRVVVLIGGNGSNLQALINAQKNATYRIVGVISHRPNVFGLQRALHNQIATKTVDHLHYSDRETFETALIEAIEDFSPDLIVLAGFMRILSTPFIMRYEGKILNIHPSLLPKYKGLHTHQRVLDAKETEHGVSVHFVTPELDDGPIVAQVCVPLFHDDTPATVEERVHKAEHWLYPQVVEWYGQNRLKWQATRLTLDGIPLGPQGLQLTLPSAQGLVS